MADNTKLIHEVFGGSDSELSDAEDSAPQHRKAPQEAYASSGNDTEDDYQGSKPKKSRRSRVQREPSSGKTSKKRKRKEPVEEVNPDELPPDQAAKYRVNQRIDKALKSGRRPIRRKKNDEALDSFADEEVARLREAMSQAALEDIQANEAKLPATAKLRLLPEAMQTLRKAALAESIVDNNLLDAVKQWLEPLPDTSLPALNIQREFFPMLRKMEFIDANVLKESRLGPVIMFYTKCKRVTPDIKKLADELVSTWSRPIIKRSASYRDRKIPIAMDDVSSKVASMRLPAILAKAKEEEKNKVKRNVVSIPQRNLGDYTVAPRASSGLRNTSIDSDTQRRRMNDARLNALKRRVQGGKT
ncbi:transcription factor iws1 [Flagelloscypha sp. PMI_526]|nr:transcription factor iws1 [Flagelloscypha sp. PMI_526]